MIPHQLALAYCIAAVTLQSGTQISPQPADQHPRVEADRLEVLRLGLESLVTGFDTREIRFVTLPLGLPDGNARHPDRLEGMLRQKSSGEFLVDAVFYQNNVAVRRQIVAQDVKTASIVWFKSPLPPDPLTAEVDHVRVVASSRDQRSQYPHQLDLTYEGHDYVHWLRSRPASLVGPEVVDGAACERVGVSLPASTNAADGDRQLVLDIDPNKDFWPRRVRVVKVADGSDYTFPIAFGDFQRVSGKWFPHRISSTLAGNLKTTHLLTDVALNPPFNAGDLRPQLPPGTVVRDQTTHATVITGGPQGEQARREAIAVEAAKQTDQGIGESVIATDPWYSGRVVTWLLLAVGVVFMLGALALRRKQTVRDPSEV